MTDGSGPLAPSGEQLRLTHGDQEAVVVTVGAALRRYRVGGHDLVDGFADDAMADGARGQALVPWPNRVRDGRWEWDGVSRQLALTEPDQGHAIHGLVRWLGWQVLARGDAEVLLGCTSWPQPGYPWPLDVTVRYLLDDGGLLVEQAVVNRGTSPAPVAAGAHPYVTVGTATVDDAVLTLPAERWLETDERQIPVATRDVAGSPFDFRAPRAIGDTRIDHALTGLRRGSDGRAVIRLEAPSTGRATELWVDAAYPYVEVFTGDALPDVSRRRQGLALEPMTAPPNALATGEDLVVLEPGGRWAGRWGIRPGRA